MERSAFEFFCIRMAGPIEIMSPAKGWVRQALQMSCESEAVFHAIVALSSANLAIASTQHPTFAGLQRPGSYTEALIQYSKTIAALHRQIRHVMDRQTSLEPVLLTCLLLMCYELHAERSSMAMRHHTLGHDIVKKHLHDRERESLRSSGSVNSLQQLANAFAQLCVGSNYPIDITGLSAKRDRGAEWQISAAQTLPRRRLRNAWEELDQLIDAGKRELSKLYQLAARHVTKVYGEALGPSVTYCLASCWSRSIELPATSTILVKIDQLLDALRQWTVTISELQIGHLQTSRAIALLQIRQWMSTFTLTTYRVTREADIDAHEAEFERVLNLAQHYLEDDPLVTRPVRPRSRYGNGQDDKFCLEEGVLSALYLVSLKSRTSATRQRAVEILANANRREGLSSSTITAQIAVAIIRVEEQRAKAMSPTPNMTQLQNHQVPEAARFTDVVRAAGDDLYRPVCHLVCARYLHDFDGSIEITQYISKGPCFPYSKCAGKCSSGFHFEVQNPPVQYTLPTQSQAID